jgi:thiamine biosynthesis protein ThiS
MIALTVNGAPRSVAGGTTVAGLLSELGLDARMIVVERNGEILRDRGEFPAIGLETGDNLELVQFVGGG